MNNAYHNYCKSELEMFESYLTALNNYPNLKQATDVNKLHDYTLQRLLGASYFAEQSGANGAEVDETYEIFRQKLDKALDNYLAK